ncbi:MAG TPA: DUF4388 domain-containing protein, partial [Ktedonobacteraceae bacterium]
SFIGTLEQYSLLNILQQAEAKTRTGLLIIRQENQWVELSFRQGQLMCIGPVRSNKTLGERLFQAGVISQKAFQTVASSPGESRQSETRTAITLIDLGYLNQESLYSWAAQEASRVLEALLAWTTGEIYFEEELQPPADRLLVALSVASLLPQQPAVSTPHPVSSGKFAAHMHEQSNRRATSPVSADALTRHDASQFFDASAISSISASLSLSEDAEADVMRHTDALSYSSVSYVSPKRVTEPLPPRRIDTSYMQPQMVLTPTDLSRLRERNPRIQLTPEQWRLFTRADGKTSLQMACQLLVMSRELVCQVAGELIELALVTISMPDSGSSNDQSRAPQDVLNASSSNTYAGHMNGNGSSYFSPAPIETYSQWGNGGNGATFVLGGGWVVSPTPSQPLQSVDPYNVNNSSYVQAGGVR